MADSTNWLNRIRGNEQDWKIHPLEQQIMKTEVSTKSDNSLFAICFQITNLPKHPTQTL